MNVVLVKTNISEPRNFDLFKFGVGSSTLYFLWLILRM